MKLGQCRKSSMSHEVYNKLKPKFKFESSYKNFREVIKQMNMLRAQNIVDNENGEDLPLNLGKIIILKNKTRLSKMFTAVGGPGKPAKRIFNLHSFQWVYRVCHKERFIMRHPELYKFRAHRQNIKMPLYDHIMNATKDYYPHSDYHA